MKYGVDLLDDRDTYCTSNVSQLFKRPKIVRRKNCLTNICDGNFAN